MSRHALEGSAGVCVCVCGGGGGGTHVPSGEAKSCRLGTLTGRSDLMGSEARGLGGAGRELSKRTPAPCLDAALATLR